MLGYIPGVAGGILCDTWYSTVGLLNVFQAGLEPSYFLSVMWREETFHGIGIQGVEVLIFVGSLFLPSVAPASQQYF
jgi:hypothetical protein